MFQEALETDFEGSVYHPKFMDFDLNLEASPAQSKEKSPDISSGDRFKNSFLSHYIFSSTFLKEKPYASTVFLDKRREINNRDLFERQIIESSGYGGSTGYNNDFVRVRGNFDSSEKEISRSFRSDQTTKNERIGVQVDPILKTIGLVQVNYTQDKFHYQEIGSTDSKGTSRNTSVSNNYTFGENKEHRLASYLQHYSLRNTRDNDNLSWSENLSIRHNEDLESLYRYNFSDQSADQVNSKQHDVNVGLKHKLYESLQSSLNMKGTFIDATGFEERSVGPSFDEAYRKEIGAAVLQLGAGVSYEDKKHDSINTTLNIINEALTLTDGTVSFLNELTGVDVSTIVVSNQTGQVIYTRGTDYQVIEYPTQRVEIRRVVGGNINSGDTVLVDYTVTKNPSFRFSSLVNNWRSQLGFFDDKVRIYYQKRQQRYFNEESDQSLILETTDDSVVGLEMRNDMVEGGVEYQKYDSNLVPFTALRSHGSLRWNISPREDFNFQCIQNHIELTNDERDSYEIRGKYSLRLMASATGNIEAGHRWEKGKDTDLRNFTTRTYYQFSVGKLFFEIGYDFEKETSSSEKRKNHFVYTKLRRDF